MRYLLLTVQFIVSGVFAVSAFGKVRAQSAFVRSLADFGVPERVRGLVGAVVTVDEVAAVVLGFAVVVGVTVRRGRRPRCRCFGVEGAPLRGAHVVRNAVLAALAAAGAVVAGVVTAVALAVVVGFDDLLEVVAPAGARVR